MLQPLIYLDNHATTRVDPEVVRAMEPYWTELYANPGSVNHEAGRFVASHITEAQARMASLLGAHAEELVFTSGATEANNLAILGVCLHPRQTRRKVVSIITEHRAVLDPLRRLERFGFEIVKIPVLQHPHPRAGLLDLQCILDQIDESVAMVSVMLANNEIGAIADLAPIGSACAAKGVWLHTDATQAVGKIPVDVDQLNVDLLSFSAHKFYGPKGIGGLYVRNRHRRVRLDPQMLGGGHQHNRRSGTLPVPGIMGMDRALTIAHARMHVESMQLQNLRDRLWKNLKAGIPELECNGPDLWNTMQRLPQNLNCFFPGIEGQTLMLRVPFVACSSGSACTSHMPEPSHVLRALGRSEDEARSSLRFGVGRFTTEDQIDIAAQAFVEAYWDCRKQYQSQQQ